MAEETPSKPGWSSSLSARLLLLTIIFVMLAEVLIWTPSIARFRKNFIEDTIARAYLATLALESLSETEPNDTLEMALLDQTGTLAISLQAADRRLLFIGDDMPPPVDVMADMMDATWLDYTASAFDTLLSHENRVVRAVGMPPNRPDIVIEVLFRENRMRDAMVDFSARILTLSIAISLFTAMLVFVALQWMIVRPVRRLTRSMVRFRENPEALPLPQGSSIRHDEIGIAQREMTEMQRQIRSAMKQKDRLATLGTGMAKINHDLRNTLATAVLVSDRLQYIEDPEVKRVTPRLMRAVDRAIEMCSQTLIYAGDDAQSLRCESLVLADLIDEVRSGFLEDETEPTLTWNIDVDPAVRLYADRLRLHRVIENLCKNAMQSGASELSFASFVDGDRAVLDICDNGPGMPEVALKNLFRPFVASGRSGGTGLGLVIVRDILLAHGATIDLDKTGPDGTRFRIVLPLNTAGAGGGNA